MKLEVSVVSSDPKLLLSDAASCPEKEIVEEGIWAVAIFVGLCMRNCNGCHYSTVFCANSYKGLKKMK